MKNFIVCVALLAAAVAYTPTAKADDILDVVVTPTILGQYGPFGMSFTWDVTTGILSDVAFTGGNGTVEPFASEFVYNPTSPEMSPIVPGGNIVTVEMDVPGVPDLIAELYQLDLGGGGHLSPIVGSDQAVSLDLACLSEACYLAEHFEGYSFGRSVAIITQAPEPSTISMLLMGLGVLVIGAIVLTRARRLQDAIAKPDAILGEV